MKSLLLMSALLAMLGLPFLAARQRDPRRGARTLVVFFAASCVVYYLYISFLHVRLYVPVPFVPQR